MSFTSSLFTGLDQFVSNIIYREAKGRFCVCFIKQWKHLFKTHRAHFWEPVRFSSPHDLVFHGASCLVLCLSGFFFFFFGDLTKRQRQNSWLCKKQLKSRSVHFAGFEAVRDIGLMMPDLLHVLVPMFEIQRLAQSKRVPVFTLFYKEELFLAFILLILFSLLGKNL